MLRKMPANKKELVRVDVVISKGFFNRHEISKFFESHDEAECYVQQFQNKHHVKSPEFSINTIQAIEIDGELNQIDYSDLKIGRLATGKKYARLDSNLSALTNYIVEVYVAQSIYPRKRWHFDKATGPDKIEYQYSTSNRFDLGDANWTVPQLLVDKPILIEITPTMILHITLGNKPITICKKFTDIAERNKLISEMKSLEVENARFINSLDENLARIASIKSQMSDNEMPPSFKR